MDEDIPLPVDLSAERNRAQCRVSGFRPLMTAFEGWTSPARQIGNDVFPPGEAIRGPSRSSTALDPEPTAQTDPQETFMTAPPDESLYRKADDQMPSDRG